MSSATEPTVLWEPTDERRERAAITRYARWLEETRDLHLPGYHDVWRWSVEDVDGFWASIWDFFAVEASQPYERVLGRREMPGTEWFPGARLSYARHIFRGRDDAEVAIRHASEHRELSEWTWGDLRSQTARLAAGLRALDGGGWEDGFLQDGELDFAELPFDHPLWVLYSSGTTGLPKPIVHSQGGIL